MMSAPQAVGQVRVPSHWSKDFIGLPFELHGRTRDGVDCYGLVRLVYRAIGIELPSYAFHYEHIGDIRSIDRIVAGAIAQVGWVPVAPLHVRERDVLVFKRNGLDYHVGIMAGRDRMLHIAQGHDSRIDIVTPAWRLRLSGVYRHSRLADGT